MKCTKWGGKQEEIPLPEPIEELGAVLEHVGGNFAREDVVIDLANE